jgi:SAM-dependent methyltransferase
MPIKYYTEKEYRSIDTMNYALSHCLNAFANYFRYKDEERLENLRDNKLKDESFFSISSYRGNKLDSRTGRYPYISNNFRTIHHLGLGLKQIILKREKKKNYKRLKFIDAGCGVGLVLIYLKNMNIDGIDYNGVEIDEENVNVAKHMCGYGINQGDILEWDFSDYDVIYYYCPINNEKLEREFELRLEDTCKVGTIIIPYSKRSTKINKDSRFKRKYVYIPDTNSSNGKSRFYYWQKVKK